MSPRMDAAAAGALLGAIGLFAVIQAGRWELGDLMTVGPGVMPMVLGLLMIFLGLLVAAERSVPVPEPAASAKPLAAILGSILAFALLIRSTGLVPATFALVLIAGLAETRYRPVTLLVTALLLTVSSYLIFIKALGVPIVPFVWPS